MNYFSHYYFDHIKDKPEHNLGLSLPDMVRNFMKGKRLKPAAESMLTDDSAQTLETGVHKHFARDKQFHASQYFRSTEEKLNRILQPGFSRLSIGRYWFASHLLTEMVLDRLLMKTRPDLLDAYYVDIAATDLNQIEAYLNSEGIGDFNAFQERLKRFGDSQYLRQYIFDPALIYSLNRIYIFTGAGSEWSKEQYTELQKMIPEIENAIFESMDSLFSEMQ